MYFDAQLSGNTIVIKSDTFWSCTVDGSIILSKYSGSGNTNISITIPYDMQYCNGKVIFSYGDGECDYPSIDIFLTNDCWIRTEPMFDNNKNISMPFENDNEIVSLKVFSNGVWKAFGEGVYCNYNELLISAKNGKNVKIFPSFNCSIPITIVLQKKGAS